MGTSEHPESGARAVDTTAPAELMPFLKSHGSQILRYVRQLLPRDVNGLIDPQDVLQEVLLEVFRRTAEFRPRDDGEALRWLMTIARSRLTDLVRAERAQKRGGLGQQLRQDSLVTVLAELALYRRTPSRSAAAHQFFSMVDAALDRLTDDQAQAVRLRYLEGLSCKEAAARMRKTDRAVEALSARGLHQLRLEMRTASLFV